jgi:hypothetical protein
VQSAEVAHCGGAGTQIPALQVWAVAHWAAAVQLWAQVKPLVQTRPLPQSTSLAHSGCCARQTLPRQTKPAPHAPDEAQVRPQVPLAPHTWPWRQSASRPQWPEGKTQALAVQVWPEPQSRSAAHCGTQRPPAEQICTLVQSLV